MPHHRSIITLATHAHVGVVSVSVCGQRQTRHGSHAVLALFATTITSAAQRRAARRNAARACGFLERATTKGHALQLQTLQTANLRRRAPPDLRCIRDEKCTSILEQHLEDPAVDTLQIFSLTALAHAPPPHPPI